MAYSTDFVYAIEPSTHIYGKRERESVKVGTGHVINIAVHISHKFNNTITKLQPAIYIIPHRCATCYWPN